MINKMDKKTISGILAFLGIWGIAAEVSLLGQSSVYQDILFLPMVFVLYKMYQLLFGRRETKGFYCLSGGLAFLFSAMLIMGAYLETQVNIFDYKALIKICLLTVAIFPVLAQITLWLNKKQETARLNSGNKCVLMICFIVLVLIWLAGWLAMFPGVYATDAPYWYQEFSTLDMPISSKYSPFYCAIFYGLVRLGMLLFDSYNAGFAVFSFVQMVFILFVIWNILSFICKRLGNIPVILATTFFTFIPTHAILAVSSAQDPVFAACLAMAVIQLLEMALDTEEFWKSKKQIIKLFVWLILLCMVRNNGFYAIFVMLLFVIIFLRQKQKQLIVMLIAVMALIQIIQGPIYDVLGIEKGTAIREMISLPLQQMAYAYNYGYDDLSPDEISKMQEYVSDEGWRVYMPCISDSIRGQLNVEAVKDNMVEFAKLYFKVFCSSPKSYINATALQTFGLWYPNKTYPDTRTWHPYIDYLCYDLSDLKDVYNYDFEVSRTSLFPVYDDMLETLFGKGDYLDGYCGGLSMAFSDIPVFGLLCKAGVYTWLLIYFFFYGIYRGWNEPFGIIGLEIGIWITVFLSPVIMYRYVAPIIFTAPLFLSLFFLPWNIKKA